MLTDTHCHMLKCYYEDMDTYIKEASDNNVKRIVVAATNLSECEEVIELGKNMKMFIIAWAFIQSFIMKILKNWKRLLEK